MNSEVSEVLRDGQCMTIPVNPNQDPHTKPRSFGTRNRRPPSYTIKRVTPEIRRNGYLVME